MRAAIVLALGFLTACGGTTTPAETTPGDTRAAPGVCVTDDERAGVDVGGTTEARMEDAMNAVDVPASPRSAEEQEQASIRGLVLFESVERGSDDPTEARVAAMMELDVLTFLGAQRAACGHEACDRVPGLLARHCPEELPPDDITAVCPTLRLFGERCAGGGG